MNRRTLLLGLTLLILSCDILRDSPFEVRSWTPGEGFHENPHEIEISLILSHESDKVRTEQAFSLTEDRRTMKGDFLWEDNTLFFRPATPLETGRDYIISLGTTAQDLCGLSLERKFEVSFTTRPPGEKIKILGTEPEHGELLYESRGVYRIFFSEPVSFGSCLDHISFNPSAAGSWRLEDENKTAVFIPREPWQNSTDYKIVLDSALSSVSGSVLGMDFSSVFCIGDDREKPVLLKALARFPGSSPEDYVIYDYAANDVVTNNYVTENISLEKPGFPEAAYTNWENYTLLELVFSEPIDTGALRNLIRIEPSISLVMESPPEMSERAVFRFTETPRWGNTYLFRLGPGLKDRAGNESEEEYLFRISCTGPYSKPPVLVGIRLPMAPGNKAAVPGGSAEHEALHFSPDSIFSDLPVTNDENHYPYMEKIPSWIELYFEIAPGTEIDLFSVMDLFRVESTNQALSFSPTSLVTSGFTWSAPKDGWGKFRRVEVRGTFINTVQSGVVTFHIPPGLSDKRGNTSDKDFRISLLK